MKIGNNKRIVQYNVKNRRLGKQEEINENQRTPQQERKSNQSNQRRVGGRERGKEMGRYGRVE